LTRPREVELSGCRIVVSYASVHTAYQLALAAQELGELKAFYCGIYDALGKWGGLVAKIIGHDALVSRRVDGLNLDEIIEFPWPLVWKSIRDRFYRHGRNDWLSTYDAFDWWVAKRIEASPPGIFVGFAGSDLRCLEVAKRHGSTLVHDCPGLHPLFEAQIMREAADRAGIRKRNARLTLGGMAARKLLEYSLADILLLYSDVHRKSFEDAGHSRERLFVSPLWVDTSAWYREALEYPEKTASEGPLKLLFVGSVNLRKGIPFLLKAVAACGNAVKLTIVGAQTSETVSQLGPENHNVKYLPPQPKSMLRKIYVSHDVFVLPSVGDSFGFVALEAMACGLPVIASENVGAPVPDPSWRVPAMDSGGLAKRIMQYVDDRMLVVQHGYEAVTFASQFRPEKYRQNIRELFKKLLDKRKLEMSQNEETNNRVVRRSH
jgi:glycosyltransferase involved in cell wall biosynthesis